MPLQRYSEECFGLAQELADSLDEVEVEALRAQLLDMGYVAWCEWREAQAARVASFAAAAPAARAKRKLPPNDRRLLTLAAYQGCADAGELLHQAAQLRPGGSYRRTAAAAMLAYGRLTDDERRTLPDWPWGDPDPYADRAFFQCR